MKVALSIMALLCSLSAQAGLIEMDQFEFGDGLITVDSHTGLGWLDVNHTANHSILDVAQRIYAGDLQGYRYASVADFKQLQSNLSLGGVAALSSLIGPTYELIFESQYADGIVFDEIIRSVRGQLSDGIGLIDFSREFPNSGTAYMYAGSENFITDLNHSHQNFGHFLVKNVFVSEPGSLGLMALGVAGLMACRRKLSAS